MCIVRCLVRRRGHPASWLTACSVDGKHLQRRARVCSRRHRVPARVVREMGCTDSDELAVEVQRPGRVLLDGRHIQGGAEGHHLGRSRPSHDGMQQTTPFLLVSSDRAQSKQQQQRRQRQWRKVVMVILWRATSAGVRWQRRPTRKRATREGIWRGMAPHCTPRMLKPSTCQLNSSYTFQKGSPLPCQGNRTLLSVYLSHVLSFPGLDPTRATPADHGAAA